MPCDSSRIPSGNDRLSTKFRAVHAGGTKASDSAGIGRLLRWCYARDRTTKAERLGAGMNLDELEADLPNGLHDALLRTFSSDAAEQRAEFILDIWIGDLHSQVISERERRSPARLELLGLAYLVIDAGNPQHVLTERSPVQLDTCGADGDLERSRQVPAGG